VTPVSAHASVSVKTMAWGTAVADPATTASELVAKAAATGAVTVLPFRRFGDAEMAALCKLLAATPSITEVHASGQALGPEGAAALGELLGSGRCALRRLAVGDQSLGTSGALRALCDGLAGAPCPLQVVDLSLKDLDGHRDGATLGAVVGQCTELCELDLSRNPQLGAPGLAAVVASGCLHAGRCLARLELSEAGLDGAAIGALADAAVGGGTSILSLQSLHLCRNPAIGGSGGAELGRLVTRLRALRSLHVQGCTLGARAAAALGGALGGDHTALVELRLSDNPELCNGGEGGEGGEGGGEGGGGEGGKGGEGNRDEVGCDEAGCAAGDADEEPDDGRVLPTSFIASSLPSRVDFEASLRLPRTARLAAERRGRLPSARVHATAARATGTTVQAADGLSAAVRSLAAAVSACPHLASVHLGGCGLDDAFAHAVCRGLAARGAQGPPADGASAGSAPPGVTSLSELDVRSNALSAAGAAALLRIRGMGRLALFDNAAIGAAMSTAAGAHDVADALHAADTLHSLDLGACGLGVAALDAICVALRGGAAARLRCLELFGNGDADSRDTWLAAMAALREERAGLDVAWKEPAGDAPLERET
jgi:hypothetical protein